MRFTTGSVVEMGSSSVLISAFNFSAASPSPTQNFKSYDLFRSNENFCLDCPLGPRKAASKVPPSCKFLTPHHTVLGFHQSSTSDTCSTDYTGCNMWLNENLATWSVHAKHNVSVPNVLCRRERTGERGHSTCLSALSTIFLCEAQFPLGFKRKYRHSSVQKMWELCCTKFSHCSWYSWCESLVD